MNAAAHVERVSDPTEVRFGERIPLELRVSLRTDHGIAGSGTLRDASISGARIETALDLPVFTNLAVTLPADGASAPRQLAACVVRHAPDGVGVEWRDMACATLLSLLGRAGNDAAKVAACDRAFR